MLGFSRETGPIGDVYISNRFWLMEAVKSRSAICKQRTREAGGVIPSESDSENHKRSGISPSPSPKAQKSDAPVSEGGSEVSHASREQILPPPFCSLQALSGLDSA